MAVAKRQREGEENGKNGTKEKLRTGVRTSGEKNRPPSWPAQFA